MQALLQTALFIFHAKKGKNCLTLLCADKLNQVMHDLESFGCFEKSKANKLFVTSKNETTNSPMPELKVLNKGQRAF